MYELDDELSKREFYYHQCKNNIENDYSMSRHIRIRM